MNITYKENTLTVDEYLSIESKMEDMDKTTKEQAERSLSNHVHSISAFVEDEIIGIGRLIGDASIYWCLVDIWVLPEHQGQGIGREIVNKLLQHIKNTSIKGTSVSVFLMCAQGKEGFYRKLGFRCRPHEYEGSGMELEMDIE
ncbi:MAG: GNAT family N-acetyltransferase [Lachnospiraceae bacterium]|nr:GNAT family N-acetyltransferase [Lachnospiraceae bacterium]